MIPTAVIVTRGDVSLEPVLESLPPEWPTCIWDNSKRSEDLKVYGYFAALAEVETDYVFTVADDAVVPAQQLVDAWQPDDANRILLNEADGETPWISFGGLFRKHLPDTAFERFIDAYGMGDDVLLWCEVIFCELTPWRNVDLGIRNLPWSRAANRMCVMPTHYAEQARVRELCAALK